MSNPFQVAIALAASADNNIAASQSPGAGAITINGSLASGGVATLDAARRVMLTSGGNDSGITFTVAGSNRDGKALTETVTGANTTTTYTTQDFNTVTGITHSGSVASTLKVGTNGVASSPWYGIDYQRLPSVSIAFAVVVSGTVNYTVEYTYDNVNAPYTGTFPTTFSHAVRQSETATGDGELKFPCSAIRVTQNSFSGSGSLKMILIQDGLD